jgi:predicted small metal-binding protein
MKKESEEKHCYKCKHFYEGFICGFEISADQETDTMEDIKDRRKGVCTLDKEE